MNKTFKLTPSIYCADTADFKTEIKKLLDADINWIHFDVMDGHYVQNYALGPKELNDIRKQYPNLTIDVHIMAYNLLNKIHLFKAANYITFHWNSVNDIVSAKMLIKEVKSNNIKVGIALDLDNKMEDILEILNDIDLITIMSIKPGFTGQTFQQSTWNTINKINNLKQHYPHLLFQIDGGVRWDNIVDLINHELDLIVVGSLLFNEEDYQMVVDKLKKKLELG